MTLIAIGRQFNYLYNPETGWVFYDGTHTGRNKGGFGDLGYFRSSLTHESFRRDLELTPEGEALLSRR